MSMTAHQLPPPPEPRTSTRPTSSSRFPSLEQWIIFKLCLIFFGIGVFISMTYFPWPAHVELVAAEFHLDSLNGSEISGGWNVTFAVSNPPGGRYYSFTDVTVVVDSTAGYNHLDRLAVSHVAKPVFSRFGGPGNRLEFQVRLFSPAQLLNDDALAEFMMDRARGFVQFDLKISMTPWYKKLLAGRLSSFQRAICPDVKFVFAHAKGKHGIAKIISGSCYFTLWGI